MSAMDLLERYLQAVGQYLPDETRGETLRELRANLLDQMDARAESQGRTLEEGDVAVGLLEHGKPEVVALRYLPQRSLIGPAVYPFYLFTLRRALPIWLFVYALAKTIDVATNAHGSFAHGLAEFALGLIPAGLAFVASVTVVFVVIDRMREQGKLGKKFYEWDPMKLEPVKPQAEVESGRSLVKRVIDLGFQALWLAYLLWVPFHPFWVIGPGVFYLDTLGVTWSPVWVLFYQLLVAGTAVKLLAKMLAFAPSAKKAAKVLTWLGEAVGFVGVIWMACHEVYFVAVSSRADMGQIATVNHAMSLAFRVAVVAAIFGKVLERLKESKGAGLKAMFAF